ncbi:hypothetical protein JCM3770_001686 [Rhodotorula araucariae]
MCGSNAHVFFGLYVKTSSLVVGARAWRTVKPALLGVDLICARRRNGTLKTSTVGTGVESLPEEVWDLVKSFIGPAAYAVAAHAFVMGYHSGHMSCDDDLFSDEDEGPYGGRMRRLYAIHHLERCDWCIEWYLDEGGNYDVFAKGKPFIDRMLEDHGLRLVADRLQTTEDMASFDHNAALAIGLPLASTSNSRLPPVAATEIFHGQEPRESQDVVRFPAEVFNLPSDASSRFARLLATFPLETVDPSSQVAAPPSQAKTQPAVEEKQPDMQVPFGRRLLEWTQRAGTPSWLLWSYSEMC